MLKAASKSAVVTPNYPVWQAGGATRKEKAIGVYSDVKAMVLLLEINSSPLLLASIDATALDPADNEVLVQRISSTAKIDPGHIFIAATHTHSAPALRNNSNDQNVVDPEYKEHVFNTLVQLTLECSENLEEASVFYRKGEIIGYYGNRDCKDKEGDQSCVLLEFKNQAGKNIAALVNLHCHPTFLDQSRLLISADLAGALRKYLSAPLGIEPLFICGVTGDMSSRYWRKDQSYFSLEHSAQAIAEKILQFPKAEELHLDQMKMKYIEYPIHQKIDHVAWQAKLDQYLKQDETETDPIEKRLLQTKIRGARNMLRVKESTVDLLLRSAIIDLGELQIVTFNNDPVVAFGKKIKQASPKKLCITLNHVNGEVGYLVEKADFDTGYIGKVTKAEPGQAEEYIDQIIAKLKEE